MKVLFVYGSETLAESTTQELGALPNVGDEFYIAGDLFGTAYRVIRREFVRENQDSQNMHIKIILESTRM